MLKALLIRCHSPPVLHGTVLIGCCTGDAHRRQRRLGAPPSTASCSLCELALHPARTPGRRSQPTEVAPAAAAVPAAAAAPEAAAVSVLPLRTSCDQFWQRRLRLRTGSAQSSPRYQVSKQPLCSMSLPVPARGGWLGTGPMCHQSG